MPRAPHLARILEQLRCSVVSQLHCSGRKLRQECVLGAWTAVHWRVLHPAVVHMPGSPHILDSEDGLLFAGKLEDELLHHLRQPRREMYLERQIQAVASACRPAAQSSELSRMLITLSSMHAACCSC